MSIRCSPSLVIMSRNMREARLREGFTRALWLLQHTLAIRRRLPLLNSNFELLLGHLIRVGHS